MTVTVTLEGVQLQLVGEPTAEGKNNATFQFVDHGANTVWKVTIPHDGIDGIIGGLSAIKTGIQIAQPGELGRMDGTLDARKKL